MSEECSKDCTAHGRLDQRVMDLERRLNEVVDDLKSRSKSNWQVVVSIGLLILSIAINTVMALIKGV